MNESSIVDKLSNSFENLIARSVDFLPKLLVAFLLVLVGVLIAGVVAKYVGKRRDLK